ncbi:MAG: Bug family tripartite tricarboxylate transporter substrate binding protein [Beijerinckiaceae bacterium]
MRYGAILMAVATGAAFPSSAFADPVAEFYKGKTVTMAVGYSPGGDYDLRTRLISRFIGKHLPGAPTIIVRNMPGGGGIVATNWLYNLAPRDGTAILVLPQAMPVMQSMGLKGVKFDVREFGWLGNSSTSPNVVNSWHSTGIKTIEDARKRELVLGSTGRGNGTYNYPASMNMFSGTKFKIVGGYRGGSNMNLAMEKGEIGGRGSNSWASWKSTKPQWLAEKKVSILVQVALKRHPDLPDVPTMIETTSDPKGKALMRFLSLDVAISRAYVTTPGVDPVRLAALRKAFEATMADKDFLAEADKTKMDISPSSADEASAAAKQIVETDAATLELARALMEPPKK